MAKREMIEQIQRELTAQAGGPDEWTDILQKSREADGWSCETVGLQERYSALPTIKIARAAQLVHDGIRRQNDTEYVQNLQQLASQGPEGVMLVRTALATLAEIKEINDFKP